MVAINRKCPFCNKDIEFIDDYSHVGFVTQKNLGFSVRQFFHLKCFETAGRNNRQEVLNDTKM